MTGEQHIEAAMDLLDEQMGVTAARPLKKRLQDVIEDLPLRQKWPKLFAVVNHVENHGLRLVKSGEGPEAA